MSEQLAYDIAFARGRGAGAADERAALVAYLNKCADEECFWDIRSIAKAIQSGAHRKQESE